MQTGTVDVNDLPAQYLGRTAGNRNGFDSSKNKENYESVLKARLEN